MQIRRGRLTILDLIFDIEDNGKGEARIDIKRVFFCFSLI